MIINTQFYTKYAVKVRVGENIRQPAGIEENAGGVMYIY